MPRADVRRRGPAWIQLTNDNKKRKRRMQSPGKQLVVGAAAIIAAATGGYFYAKRNEEAIPLPGPIGGGSLSSWKDAEAAGKPEERKDGEEPGNLSKLKLKEPAAVPGKLEDEKGIQPVEKDAGFLNLSSAKDDAN